MFKINLANVYSALTYGVLSALLAMFLYIIELKDVFAIDWKMLTNAGVFGFLIVMVSLIKNLLTTDKGNFVGLIKVIPTIKEE